MTDLQGFKSAIEEAKSILIFLPENPSQDIVAAGLGLYLSLKESGKAVTPISGDKPIVRDSHLVGLDQVTSEVGGNNLVITFNLPEDAVDKVTSNTEGGHLNLIVSPKDGEAPIKKENLTFNYSGAAADVVIVVGANALSDLGPIYEKEIKLFESAKVVNFGSSSTSFGAVNFTDPSSSNSELVAATIQELHLPINADIASNLMQGIEDATQGLSSPNMTADTFEAIAVLYRNGARRRGPKVEAPQVKVVADTPIIDVENKEVVRSQAQPEKELEVVEEADWLKPKIMKGGVSTK